MTMNMSFFEQVRTPGAISPEEMMKVQEAYNSILLQTDPNQVMARIPRTYAEALLVAAESRNEVAAVASNLFSVISDVYPAVPALEAYLGSLSVNRLAKDELIMKVFEPQANPLVLDFLRLLNRKDRLGMLRLITTAFHALLEQRYHRQRVLVDTAAPLTDEQKTALTATLEAVLKKTPVLIVRENPELIGGLVVHVGDKVFDTSIRSRLTTIRNQLLARGTHEIQQRRDRFGHS